jgi:hypothetical protein
MNQSALAGPPPPPSPWEFKVWGSYLTTTGDHYLTSPSEPDFSGVPAAGQGGGIQAYVAYDFTPHWDARLTGAGNWLDNAYYYSYGPGHARSKTSVNYYFADFDAGYSFNPCPNTSLRLAGGIEYANFASKWKVGENFAGHYYYDAGLKNNFWGVGPHASVEGSYALGRSGFSLVGSVDGSVLFGNLSQSGLQIPDLSSGGGGRTAYSARAYAGIAYALPIPNVDASIEGGIQVQQWWNVNNTTLFDSGKTHASETFWGPTFGVEFRW